MAWGSYPGKGGLGRSCQDDYKDFLGDLLRSERLEHGMDQSEILLEFLPLSIQLLSPTQHITSTSRPGHCADFKKILGPEAGGWNDGGLGLSLEAGMMEARV